MDTVRFEDRARARAAQQTARVTGGEAGQSLVEISLTLPFLLLIVIGVADFARYAYYASAVTNASREAALFAARDAQATSAQVAQRACDELGFAPFGSPCPPSVRVECFRNNRPCDSARGKPGDVHIHVDYDFTFLSAYLVQRVFAVNPLTIRAHATFPGLDE